MVRSELNSQILSYDHFSGEKLRIGQGPRAARFPLSPNYSKSREGSTSHILEASWKHPGDSREKSNFHQNIDFVE